MTNDEKFEFNEKKRKFFRKTLLSVAFGTLGAIAIGCVLPNFLKYRIIS